MFYQYLRRPVMNQAAIKVIQAALQEILSKDASFPKHLERLMGVGIIKYHVDLQQSCIQYGDNTQATHEEKIPASFTVKRYFCKESLVDAIRWAQQNGPDYNYLEFLQKIAEGGVASYRVDIQKKHVDYCGLNGEIHTEFFPSSPKPQP